MPRRPDPRIAYFCRCGASWFGRFAVDNPVILEHERQCGPLISAEAYESQGHRIIWPGRNGTGRPRVPDDTGYDIDMDRAALWAEARLEDEDAAYIDQLADMRDSRGLPWILMELARLERRDEEQIPTENENGPTRMGNASAQSEEVKG